LGTSRSWKSVEYLSGKEENGRVLRQRDDALAAANLFPEGEAVKSIVILKLSILFLIAISTVNLPAPTGPSTPGVFVGSSPCAYISRSLLKIPETADCELIKWHLTLYSDPSTLAPTTYELNYFYGLPEQGTNGLSRVRTKVERKGRWTAVRGTRTDPDAIVYRLDGDKPQESLSFLKLDDYLVHLLDRDGGLMVGSAGWSYTLNRVGDYGRQTQQTRPLSISTVESSAPTPSVPPVTADSVVLGAFVGRSPCRDAAIQLNKAVKADCVKVKWDLTLYRNPSTLTPTTYKLKGTFYRERIREGKWTIVRGIKVNPDAIVYQLDPDKPQESLSFFKAADNILFFLDKERNLLIGNGDFSYTLNKADKVLER
jgi:NlpE N-terminal domain